MHAPVPVSQIVRPCCWQFVFDVHAAWHWWSAQHAGAAAPQSAFDAHARQRPLMQRGSLAGQFESPVHSTHPSVGSQIGCCPPHWLVPFTPQTALPPPGPPVFTPLEPPHAMMTPMTEAKTKGFLMKV